MNMRAAIKYKWNDLELFILMLNEYFSILPCWRFQHLCMYIFRLYLFFLLKYMQSREILIYESYFILRSKQRKTENKKKTEKCTLYIVYFIISFFFFIFYKFSFKIEYSYLCNKCIYFEQGKKLFSDLNHDYAISFFVSFINHQNTRDAYFSHEFFFSFYFTLCEQRSRDFPIT